MTPCHISGAKLQHNTERDSSDSPSDSARWLLDYLAMHLDEMTHPEHQLVVALWVLHTKEKHSDKVLANYIELPKSHWERDIGASNC